MYNSCMVWLFFIIGQVLCVLKRASFAIRGPNSIKTRWEYFYHYWDIILVRDTVGTIIFWLWASYPAFLNVIAGKVGLSYDLTIPVIPPVALAFGLFIDVLLDWVSSHIPILQRELPQLDKSGADK